MSKLNWRKAQLNAKRSLSTVDEDEYRGKDAAARWLERREKPKPAKRSFMAERRQESAA